MALTETNFEILTAEVFKQEPTYVSGVPTTTIGPPTTGSHVLDEIWKDALGGVFKCTVAGTPGTWKQILPAAVTADPSSGTIPTGYLILNVTQGTLKRHAGGYSWETIVGATGGKIGFYGLAGSCRYSRHRQALGLFVSARSVMYSTEYTVPTSPVIVRPAYVWMSSSCVWAEPTGRVAQAAKHNMVRNRICFEDRVFI